MKHAHGTVMPEPGVPGGVALAPHIWQISQPFSNQGGQIIPTYYYWHPQCFSPSGITGSIKYLNLIYAGINITFTTESHSTYSYEM